MPSTPYLSQPPVNSPDPVGVFEANFGRLPPDGEQLLIPHSPDSARLYPLGELLGLGYVFLHVSGGTLPLPHLLYPSAREQVALADLSAALIAGKFMRLVS